MKQKLSTFHETFKDLPAPQNFPIYVQNKMFLTRGRQCKGPHVFYEQSLQIVSTMRTHIYLIEAE